MEKRRIEHVCEGDDSKTTISGYGKPADFVKILADIEDLRTTVIMENKDWLEQAYTADGIGYMRVREDLVPKGDTHE